MDLLNIDFNSLLPHVIEAYTKVYGEEYHSIISEKINNAFVVQYYNVDGISNYISFLEHCKRRELSIRLLEEFGIDISKYKIDNYTKPFDSELDNILENFIDTPFVGFSIRADYWAPLYAFKPNNEASTERILQNKLKLINYLRGEDKEKVTEDNFDAFTKTKEYEELLKKIDEYNSIYDRIFKEYNEWKESLSSYEEFIKAERKRLDDILKIKKEDIFQKIFWELPFSVKDAIFEKSLDEQQDVIFGSPDISMKLLVEFFSKEQMEILKSSDSRHWDKYWIILNQVDYLKKLGVNVPDEETLRCETEEALNNYLEFLNQDCVKKYVPSESTISLISSLKEKKYEESLREYYTTREDFIKTMKSFGDNSTNIESIYNQFKNKTICIAGQGATRDGDVFVSIMFYNIRVGDGGFLFHLFMHECGHIIDQSKNGCGFEPFEDFDGNSEKNPYDKAFRKYEKFNETLNDMFTIEAVKYLQDRGIYLIEPKELTVLDTSNSNTTLITKNLLKPLLQKFKPQVAKAKVNANSEELTKYIGRDNFEDLVDAVNKVDYLSRNGVVPKIENEPDDPMVKEYFEQVERVGQIYINIDEYYSSNFESSSEDENKVSNKK